MIAPPFGASGEGGVAVADAGEVILVDENDTVLGVCDKATAHQEGRLHRAFSIVLF